MRTGEDDALSYDESDLIVQLCGNPNLAELLSVRIDCRTSALKCFVGKLFENDNCAVKLRSGQNYRLAMCHVERGAELTRNSKCFEAIQCFNKALNVDDKCVDAYVGRGAACAGSNNFLAALTDFEKALELNSEHKNAKRYRVEVLIAYGKDLEKDGKLLEAREKYERALEFTDGLNERALNALQRISLLLSSDKSSSSSNNFDISIINVQSNELVEIVDLSDDSEDDKRLDKRSNGKEKIIKVRGRHLNCSNDRKRFVSNGDFNNVKYERVPHKRESTASTNGLKVHNISNNLDAKRVYAIDSYKKNTLLGQTPSKSLNKSLPIKDSDENHRKLQEMEAFILELKKSKK